MLITALAWEITPGIALVMPLAWMQWRRSPWAMAWAVTTLFAVMEMWQAEHRLGLVRAWEIAYWRDIGALKQERQQSHQPPPTPGGGDILFPPATGLAAQPPYAQFQSDYGFRHELARNNRIASEGSTTTSDVLSWPWFAHSGNGMFARRSQSDQITSSVELPYRSRTNTPLHFT
jgi:hypothetical protein